MTQRSYRENVLKLHIGSLQYSISSASTPVRGLNSKMSFSMLERISTVENEILSERPSPERDSRLSRLSQLKEEYIQLEKRRKYLLSSQKQRQSMAPGKVLKTSRIIEESKPVSVVYKPIHQSEECEISDSFESCSEFCAPVTEAFASICVYSEHEYISHVICPIISLQIFDVPVKHFTKRDQSIEFTATIVQPCYSTTFKSVTQTFTGEVNHSQPVTRLLCEPCKLKIPNTGCISVQTCLHKVKQNTLIKSASKTCCATSSHIQRAESLLFYFSFVCLKLHILYMNTIFWTLMIILTTLLCGVNFMLKLPLIASLKNSGFTPTYFVDCYNYFCLLFYHKPYGLRTDFGGEC